MKLSGILFGLFAALSFSFAEVNITPLNCGGCAGDEKEECDGCDKEECSKEKCSKEGKKKKCCGEDKEA